MASNNIFQKAEDWLDDLETVGNYAAEKIGSVTKDMPIVKSLGAIAANPTRQEIGAQVINLASATNKGLQESFGGDPVDMALNYGPGAIGAMTAFHGTPHKIVGGFKKAAIGSGEGAQAFGHGFYATDLKDIAKTYTKAGIVDTTPEIYADRVVKNFKGDEVNAVKWMSNEVIKPDLSPNTKALYEKAIKAIKNKTYGTPEGYIYTLDIPEPDVMLDWDKPLGKQSPAIKKAIEETKKYITENNIADLGGDINLLYGPNVTPSQFLNTWESLGGKTGVGEELLSKSGIKGIRYKAGQISGAKTDASNYVIFEPEDIKILAEDFLDQ